MQTIAHKWLFPIVAMLFTAQLVSCDSNWEETDCHEHGEFIEGDCVCELGWGGLGCEVWLPDTYRGAFTLKEDTCGIVPWGMDSIIIGTSSVMPRGFFIHCKAFKYPLTANIPWLDYHDNIPEQAIMILDSLGNDSTMIISGSLDHWYPDSVLRFTRGNDSCAAFFQRY